MMFIVETGDYHRRILARGAASAVVKAFKQSAPKRPGILTRVHMYQRCFFYVDTVHFLRKAGYKVGKR